jgi:uncharacterized protein
MPRRRIIPGSIASSPLKRLIIRATLVLFVGINAIAYLGAYAATHYGNPGQFSLLSRPINSKFPSEVGLDYKTERIAINPSEWLEAWSIPVQQPSKGTILLFPGNGGTKGKQLLAPAQVFHALGYDALLIDFRGVGGSSGNTTTLGVKEAKDVAVAVRHVQQLSLKQPMILYGVSMGSAAILKAIAQEGITPDAVILELPFARLLDAVRSRLHDRRLPTFAIAELVVFWGSIQHGFNGFSHNPVTYASKVNCPTLLLQGKYDKWTTSAELNEILQNLGGAGQLVIFPTAGHDLLVTVDKDFWSSRVQKFLEAIDQ